MDDQNNFEVVEWTITNFSCWNEDIHDAVIESQEFGGVLGVSLKFELHPKDPGEHLFARIRCDEPVAFQGTFSIIGSDSSILCSSEYNEYGKTVGLAGPRFDEVVAHIRKNEIAHQDKLSLKLRMRWKYNKVMLARTEISAYRSLWRFSTPTLKNLQSGFNWISRIFYPLDDGSMGEMDLIALRGDDSELNFRLDHESSFLKNVLLFVNVSVFEENSAVVLETEYKERVFREREDWMFWNSPLIKDTGEDLSLDIRVKIVPSVKYKHQGAHYMPSFVSRYCLIAPSYRTND